MALLDKWRSCSYDQLAALPASIDLDVPEDLRGFRIRLVRSKGERGGVAIEVVISERSLLIFEHRIALGFEKLPDGKTFSLQEVSDDD